MPSFRVKLRTLAYVEGWAEVKAVDEKKAEEAAIDLAQAGEICWKHDGIYSDRRDDFTVEGVVESR
jgi:hypothetical protein